MNWFRKPRLIKAPKELDQRSSLPANVYTEILSSDILVNDRILRQIFHNCSDIVFRPIQIKGQTKVLLIYVEGLNDTRALDEVVLKPLMFEGLPEGLGKVDSIGQVIQHQLVAISKIKTVSTVKDLVDGVLKASIAILIDGENRALIAELKASEKRGIEESGSEASVRGPRDSFTETLRINTSLVRKRIRSTQLKMEPVTVGQVSQTDVVITYLEGIATNTIVEEVRKRIQRIQIDGVLESGYIEEFIEDVTWSPFPQVQNTERPDVVCASLFEGKVAILVDNTPFALIVPMTFWSGLQAAEDYYERSVYTTAIRFIRYVLFNVALFLPSLFVAISTFHPQLIPTSLLITIAAAREGIPFPAVVEIFLMEFMFEGLREAGIRLPKSVGSAVSIVGALVIGQSAVQAGIVSAPTVIIVATTGIASFAIPRYNLGTGYRLLRFPILILAGMLGLYGVILGAIVITIHLVCLRSFGTPYLTPIAPQIPSNLKDVFIRAPWWSMNDRPVFISGEDKTRIPKGQQPSPKRGKKGK